MILETTAGQLRSALSAFQGVIETRSTIPVLGTVRFRDGRLTGTDLDMEVSVAIAALGPMEGEACIDWHSLFALSRCLEAGEAVTLAEEDMRASATFARGQYRMASLPAGDFPDFPAIDGETSATGNLGLVAAMARVRHAISTEETRYYLNGVAIVKDDDGRTVLAATDGRRLAMMPLDGAPEDAIGMIIPHRLVRLLVARRAEPEACVFDRNRTNARFVLAGTTVSAKLIDGKYPDIAKVLPKAPPALFSTGRAEMLRALKRLRSFARGVLGVKLTLAGDSLTLAMTDPNSGSSAAETVYVDGEAPMEAGFNADYLIAALSAAQGETVQFAGEDHGGAPVEIRSEGDPLRQLIMPMRV